MSAACCCHVLLRAELRFLCAWHWVPPDDGLFVNCLPKACCSRLLVVGVVCCWPNGASPCWLIWSRKMPHWIHIRTFACWPSPRVFQSSPVLYLAWCRQYRPAEQISPPR